MKELIKSINLIKVELQKTKLKKSGVNKFAKFKYYELSDFLPTLNILMQKYNIIDVFEQDDNAFKLTLIGENGQVTHKVRYLDTSEHSKQIKGIQWIGSEQTYFRRYLYMLAFGICESDAIDAVDNKPQQTANKKETVKNDNVTNLQKELKDIVYSYCTIKPDVLAKDMFATLKINANSTEEQLQQAINYTKELIKAEENAN